MCMQVRWVQLSAGKNVRPMRDMGATWMEDELASETTRNTRILRKDAEGCSFNGGTFPPLSLYR